MAEIATNLIVVALSSLHHPRIQMWDKMAGGDGALSMQGRPLIATLATAAVALLIAGCGDGSHSPASAPSPTTATFTVTGTLRLAGSAEGGYGDGCHGTNGYDDLEAGAQVTIADANGKTVGLGELGKGHRMTTPGVCAWDFTVDGIPYTEGASGIYSVSVSHRGSISFKRSEATDVELSIGG